MNELANYLLDILLPGDETNCFLLKCSLKNLNATAINITLAKFKGIYTTYSNSLLTEIQIISKREKRRIHGVEVKDIHDIKTKETISIDQFSNKSYVWKSYSKVNTEPYRVN
jgi:hypothetical protein